VRRAAAPLTCLAAALLALRCVPAFAWGDEGHEAIGLIAERYLEPRVLLRVREILASDDSGLTATDIAHEATWADKYRDSDRDGAKVRYLGTRDWHFVDLEITGADLNSACFGWPALPAGAVASRGPAQDCIVEKIDEFLAELRNPATNPSEQRVALQFLLHLVGDLHQPLHASDDHDQGGNRKIVSAPGLAPNTLHHYWDMVFVERLGRDAADIAHRIGPTGESDRARWSKGAPADWAMESFAVAQSHVYGPLPDRGARHRYELSSAYLEDATAVTAVQLDKAGVRLAWLLNQALR